MGRIELTYVPTEEQLADPFTKPTPRPALAIAGISSMINLFFTQIQRRYQHDLPLNNELWPRRISRNDPDKMRDLFNMAVFLVRSQWPSSIGAAVGKWSEVKRWESCSALYIQIRCLWSVFSSNAIILSSMKRIRALTKLFADAGR
jgi:hypothetical protein